jgi:catechol 2,3-dioxygenase-like lactoylglutathione lyase family enzyme
MAEASGPLGTIQLAATTLYVSDLDVSLRWYEEKLGLRPVMTGSDGHAYATFQMGAALVVLEPREAALEPAAFGTDSATVNVVIDRDPAEVRDELLGRGVSCSHVVESGFRSFLVRDPDGNRFYVTRPLAPAG